MTTENKEKILAAFEKFLMDNKISANDAAKKTNINAAYISAMRAGSDVIKVGNKEVLIADKYYKAIAHLIDFKLEKSYWKTVATPQLLAILSILEDAKKFGYTNVIIGETGSGKSYVTSMFAQKHPLDCFHIIVSSQDSIGDLLEKICEKIHISTEKTKSKTLRSITKKLKNMKADGFKPMLVFDEAEYMRQPALCNIKELYDNLTGVCSIVLIGTDQLTRQIDRLRKKNKDGIPQLYRRIKYGIRVLPAVDKTFKQFLNDVLIDKNVIKFVSENCDNYGELHDLLMPAIRESERLQQDVTVDLIRTILNMPHNG